LAIKRRSVGDDKYENPWKQTDQAAWQTAEVRMRFASEEELIRPATAQRNRKNKAMESRNPRCPRQPGTLSTVHQKSAHVLPGTPPFRELIGEREEKGRLPRGEGESVEHDKKYREEALGAALSAGSGPAAAGRAGSARILQQLESTR